MGVDRLQMAALVSTSMLKALLYLSRVVARRHCLVHLDVSEFENSLKIHEPIFICYMIDNT